MKGVHVTLFLLLATGLAGCLGDDGDAAGNGGDGQRDHAVLCREGICNFQATVDPADRQANELSIAVNPLDPLNMLASGKDYTPSEAGDCVWDGLYVTHDGGLTWANSNLPGSNWRLLDDPTSYEPHPQLSRFWCATDPVLAFGPDGTAYWTVMPYQCDTLSGSKFGREFVPGTGVGLPDGGLNDWFWTCSSMYVLVSEDGGDTWPIVNEVAFGPRLEHDKQWISVAPDGTVLLCWDRDPTYQITNALDQVSSQLTAPGYMVCSTSTDKGRTWSDVTDVNPEGTWDGFLPWVDWTSDNVAWMAALDAAGNILVSSSQDGLAWDDPTVVGSYENPPPNGEFGWPALNGSTFRSFALPAMAVDRSGGPFDGALYVTWMDHSGGDGDVLVAISHDDGATWSDPVPVHHEPAAVGFDQFMPAVAVGPDGTADLIWYDRRDDPADHLFHLYHAYSTDGGATWSDGLRVSEHASDEQYSHHQNGMIFLGDYIDLDASWGQAHAVWVDTRNNKADAFVATIERPSANGAQDA
ncbi:MAG: sialidase family protein [Thermoplasmatota archaeon]